MYLRALTLLKTCYNPTCIPLVAKYSINKGVKQSSEVDIVMHYRQVQIQRGCSSDADTPHFHLMTAQEQQPG